MTQWSGKTKGTLLGYKVFLYSIKIFGLNVAYFVLRFVSFYFYVFAHKNRNEMADFYVKTLGVSRKKALGLTRKNFYIFGQTLIDRNAILLNKAKRLTFSFVNEPHLKEAKDNGKGAVLISAHIGNWETAGNFLKKRVSNKINAVMLDAEAERIKEYLNKSTGGSQFNIIPIKNDFSHVIKINNALSSNEFIAIHADRHRTGNKFIELDFFGHPVKFPYGPFLIAYKFKVPIFFVFAVKENDRHYKLIASKPVKTTDSVEAIAGAYVKELEDMVTKYPHQWFNYYNYFE